MVRLLHRTCRVDHHAVVALVILQVVVVLAIGKRDIALVRQQPLLRPVFIDHVPAIVRRGGRPVDYIHCTELGAVRAVSVSNATSIRKRDFARQI